MLTKDGLFDPITGSDLVCCEFAVRFGLDLGQTYYILWFDPVKCINCPKPTYPVTRFTFERGDVNDHTWSEGQYVWDEKSVRVTYNVPSASLFDNQTSFITELTTELQLWLKIPLDDTNAWFIERYIAVSKSPFEYL